MTIAWCKEGKRVQISRGSSILGLTDPSTGLALSAVGLEEGGNVFVGNGEGGDNIKRAILKPGDIYVVNRGVGLPAGYLEGLSAEQ